MSPLFLKVLCVSVVGMLLTACSSRETVIDSDLAAFGVAFRKANEERSLSDAMALYALDGSDRSTQDLLEVAVESELGLPIESIVFLALTGAPEEEIRYTFKGKVYGPTIEPLRRMEVRYATDDRFMSRYTLGKDANDQWKIVSSKPVSNNNKAEP